MLSITEEWAIKPYIMEKFQTIDFVDLKAQQEVIYSDLMDRLHKVLAHGKYIMGPEIDELEERLAAYVGVRHVITCSSGTDALLMSLMAFNIGPGDAVFTSPFTFIATAEVILLLGATPVFVDIDPRTFTINPELLAEALDHFGNNSRTEHLQPKAIIPVDLFGQPADYEEINKVAEAHNLIVVEDAAQSFGATYKGKKAGSLGDIAATSFFPAKPLGCYGDGGAIFTDDDGLAAVLRSIRVHGQGSSQYDNVRLGLNGRLDTLQAAVLLAKLAVFEREVAARQEVAQRYSEGLAPAVKVPYVAPDRQSIWAQYSVLSDRRNELTSALQEAGIPTAVYYPLPLHLQGAFRHLGYQRGDFPVSETSSRQIFSLPMHPYLSAKQQTTIIQALLTVSGNLL